MPAATIPFGPHACTDLTVGANLEWVVADGAGGYASGTVSGLRTRRYHALQVVAGQTAASRHVGLVALDPVLRLPSGAIVELGTHEWASGTLAPNGHRYLQSFDLTDGLPRWHWQIGDIVLERELAIRHGSPCLGVVHRLLSGGPVELILRTLVTWRDAHAERGAGGPAPELTPTADGTIVDGAYRLAGPTWYPKGEWWLGVYHREEAARGLAPVEDLFHAGDFVAQLDAPGDTMQVTAWAAGPDGDLASSPPPAVEIVAGARRRAAEVVAAADPADGTGAILALAADTFVVRCGGQLDVVAGYPWFGAWSRDTMTAYEGLFLSTGRAAEGRELLLGYAATLSEGMLANTADTGQVEYNTADATLWFLHAVGRHVTVTGDADLAAELLDPLSGVVTAHLAGTRYGIVADADGLITQGAPGHALTWMDARVDGVPVTPRVGKPVEVNALWVSGLAALVRMSAATGRDAADLQRLHDRARAAFRRRFPAPHGWLYDVVDGPAGDDPSLRPNQLLAYSLPDAPMDPDPAVLDLIGARLATPLGPRSLSPDDPAYRPTHRGGPAERDSAYHQGTVWPWLTGPYVDALRRCGRDPVSLLAGIDGHLSEWGVGSVSETADGDPAHNATGCPFQAWSVAELTRLRIG